MKYFSIEFFNKKKKEPIIILYRTNSYYHLLHYLYISFIYLNLTFSVLRTWNFFIGYNFRLIWIMSHSTFFSFLFQVYFMSYAISRKNVLQWISRTQALTVTGEQSCRIFLLFSLFVYLRREKKIMKNQLLYLNKIKHNNFFF